MILNDTIILRKQNGKEYPNISADVQTKMIFIEDYMLPIEEDDYIIRILPNGLEEIFIVVDRGFCDNHYQVSVKRYKS